MPQPTAARKRVLKSRPATRAYQTAQRAVAASAKTAVANMLVEKSFEETLEKTAEALSNGVLSRGNGLNQVLERNRHLFLHPKTQELTIHGRQVLWWVLQHPGAPSEQIHAQFPGEKGPLSALLSSESFNREYKEALERINQHVIGDMVNKLSRTAHALLTQIENRAKSGKASEKFLTEAGELVLRSIGFGPEAVSPATKIDIGIGNQQPITIQVDATDLNKARDLAAQAFKGQSESRLISPPIDVTPEAASGNR